MLSTEELREYIEREIQSKIGPISCDYVFFKEGTDNSIEGTYIFSRDNAYHIIFTEKGKIRSDIVTQDEREVLWNAIEIFSNNIIMNFAMKNREANRDFRRALFEKEKQIFALFGEDFLQRKKAEIEEILERNPFIDM